MRAIEISKPGPPEVLTAVERPTPTPGAGEVLIKVAAAGVNRPDVLQRRGRYPPPPGASDIPGLEIAGRVEAVGPGVTAAAIPETFFTVWTNVFERGRLKARESILVHGGSSGIGTTAIQLARAF